MQDDIKKAFMDIMDGMTIEDLQHITGLSVERCQEIYRLHANLSNDNDVQPSLFFDD